MVKFRDLNSTIFQLGKNTRGSLITQPPSTPLGDLPLDEDDDNLGGGGDEDSDEESDPEVISDDEHVSDRLLVDGLVSLHNIDLLDFLSDLPRRAEARPMTSSFNTRFCMHAPTSTHEPMTDADWL
jgi:hypothetical protein